MNDGDDSALHAIVRGRVQGVGFRFFVERQANGLGLAGWVRNISDGAVEVLAEGAMPQLEALLASLQRGPRFAQVEAVESDWREATARSGPSRC